MSKDRPPTYEVRTDEVLPVWAGQGVRSSGRSGEIGAGDARGQVGAAAAGTLGSAKKMQKTVHFSLENFAK